MNKISIEYLFYRACMLYENFRREPAGFAGGALGMSLFIYICHILWFASIIVPIDFALIVILFFVVGAIGTIIGDKNKDTYLLLKYNYRSERNKNQKDIITLFFLIIAPFLMFFLH